VAIIGVDVGGTKILAAIVDPATGEIHRRTQLPTPRHDPDAVPAAIGDAIAALLAAGPESMARSGDELRGIGVGVPGLVDRSGILHYGPNVPGVIGLDIAGILRRRFEVPVVATNDANNAAVAEHRLGAARGFDDVVVVTQGTGIGGAIIANGQLIRGVNGFAGEPGHMLVDRFGHLCACGQRGCWETVASGSGLVNITSELIDVGRARAILELAGGVRSHIRGEHVAAALAAGDGDAHEVLERFSAWVAAGIGSLVNLLDPAIVVLGGGLTTISGHFLDQVRSRVMAMTMGGAYRPAVQVVSAELGPEAGAIGAAINASDWLGV
jgi:glucokinase